MISERLPFLFALLGFGLVCSLTACDESVYPILESDRETTVYGTLDTALDTQYVRIIPIRETIFPGGAEPLPLQVTTTDLTSGATSTWQDSVVTYNDGTIGHVFYVPLRPVPGHAYRLEIRSEDGALLTSAQTAIPARPEVDIRPETVRRVLNNDVLASQEIFWTGLTRPPYRVEHWYRFLDLGDFDFEDVLMPVDPPYAYTGSGLDVALNLRADRAILDTMMVIPQFALAGIGMTVVIMNDGFDPPGGVFDPEVLVQPGTFSNVEGGFGYFGAVGRYHAEWVLRDSSAQLLGYIPIESFGQKVSRPPAGLGPVFVRR